MHGLHIACVNMAFINGTYATLWRTPYLSDHPFLLSIARYAGIYRHAAGPCRLWEDSFSQKRKCVPSYPYNIESIIFLSNKRKAHSKLVSTYMIMILSPTPAEYPNEIWKEWEWHSWTWTLDPSGTSINSLYGSCLFPTRARPFWSLLNWPMSTAACHLMLSGQCKWYPKF